MNREVSLKKWVSVLGKEKLQTFHDRFSTANGIGFKLSDTNGHELIVPSKRCLLCHEMKKYINATCKEEKMAAQKKVAESGKVETFTCSMGVTVFICPLYSNNKLVGFGTGGYVVCENSPITEGIIQKFHLQKMSLQNISAVGEYYASIADLLNADFTKLYAEDAQNNQEPIQINDPCLTARQAEVAKLICQGCSNKEIGEKLSISDKTVKIHVSSILAKLNIKDRTQIVVYYAQARNK